MTGKRKWTIAAISLLAVGLAIQPFRPKRNQDRGPFPQDITAVLHVPGNVQNVLQSACYDCHSNHTDYPWYADVQPGGWYLARHVNAGKAELNFHEFGTYPKRKQESKLKAIGNQVRDGEMPLSSYQWLHPNARLDIAQKQIILAWARAAADSLAALE